MDFLNKKKVQELKDCIEDKDREIKSLRENLDEANKKIRGARVCGAYCKNCKHGIESKVFSFGGYYTTYSCELDCKCKDFSQ